LGLEKDKMGQPLVRPVRRD